MGIGENPINTDSPNNVTIIDSSTLGTMSSDEMMYLRQKFRIPAGVRLRIPSSSEDRPCHSKPGEICFYAIAFECGLRLPLHPFIRALLDHFSLAPSQLVPNAWRHIVGAIILWQICSEEKDHITLDEFIYCYRLQEKSNHQNGGWYLSPRPGRLLVLDCPSYTKHRGNKFFFASGTDLEFSPKEGKLPCAPPVPKEWGFPDKCKLKEPVLNSIYMSRVKRALDFKNRSYNNLITQENVQKYLLDDSSALSSPSFPGKCLDPKISPESFRYTKSKGSADMEDDCIAPPLTKKLCSIGMRKLDDVSKLSTKPWGLTSPDIVESSSSESSVQIVDKVEKGLPLQDKDHDLIFKREIELLTVDEMKQMEDLRFDETLLEMMLAYCAQSKSGFRNKQVSKQEETIASQKSPIAYLDLLETNDRLSKDMDTIKNQLAKAEKSLKGQEYEIHAKDAELHAKELKLHAKDAELCAKDAELRAKNAELHSKDVKLRAKDEELREKDEQIQTLKENVMNAVKKFKESIKYENVMGQCFLRGYDAFRSQASSHPP